MANWLTFMPEPLWSDTSDWKIDWCKSLIHCDQHNRLTNRLKLIFKLQKGFSSLPNRLWLWLWNRLKNRLFWSRCWNKTSIIDYSIDLKKNHSFSSDWCIKRIDWQIDSCLYVQDSRKTRHAKVDWAIDLASFKTL